MPLDLPRPVSILPWLCQREGGLLHEEDVPAKSAPSKQDARLPGADENPGGPEGAETSAREGPQAPHRLGRRADQRLRRAFSLPRRAASSSGRYPGGLPAREPRRTAELCSALASSWAGSTASRICGEPASGRRSRSEPGAATASRSVPMPRGPGARRNGCGLHWPCARAGTPISRASRRNATGGGWTDRRTVANQLMGSELCMGVMAVLVSGAVRAYQLLLRPVLPSVCRFEPSCSEYYRQALATTGFWLGTWLAIRRLARCHPWNPGGYDPPPAARHNPRNSPGA